MVFCYYWVLQEGDSNKKGYEIPSESTKTKKGSGQRKREKKKEKKRRKEEEKREVIQ